MHQTRHLLQKVFLAFMAPLTLCALTLLFKYLLIQAFFNNRPPINHKDLSFDLNENHHSQILASFFSLISKAKTATFNAYSSFSVFLIIMALANIFYMIKSLGISELFKNKSGQLDTTPFQNHPIQKGLHSPRGYPRIFKGIIIYGVISFLFHPATSAPVYSHSEFLSNSNIPSRNEFLEHKETTEISPSVSPSSVISTSSESLFSKENQEYAPISSDIRTLSIGKVLSTLKLSPDSIILSHDSRLAFITLKVYGTLKIIDITDDQNPFIVGSLKSLAPLDLKYHYKKLVLSADGQTLFASTMQDLEIIDVADPQNPVLKAKVEDPRFNLIREAPLYCIPTMALASDENTLYVAGIGFQIINITNTSNPQILFSNDTSRRLFRKTSLALLPDSKTLLYGDETLGFYDVSDPTKPKLKHSYKGSNVLISSVLLSKDSKTVYATGLHSRNRSLVMLEEIDISQRESPKSLGQYQITKAGLGEPSIVAISPNETNIFVMNGVPTAMNDAQYEITGFDLLKKQIMVQSSNFFFNAMTFVMIPGTEKVITNSNGQFQITQLFKTYPNTKNFCLTNTSRGNFQFSEYVKIIIPSEDQSVLIMLSFDPSLLLISLETYNSTNKAQLSSFSLKTEARDNPYVQLFAQSNSALVQHKDTFYAFEISDPTNIILKGSFSPTEEDGAEIENVYHSPQEKMLVIITEQVGAEEYDVEIINYSDMSSIIEAPLQKLSHDDIAFQAYFLHKRKLLFFFNKNFRVYDISDPIAPKLISSQELAPFEGFDVVLPATFSNDENTLFTVVIDRSELAHLYAIDISDLTNFKVLAELELPKITQDPGIHPLILSRDMKRGYLITDRNILVIDFTNLTSPVILGMISLGILSDQEVSNFFLSPDEKIGYLAGHQGQLLQISLDFPYTLYLQQEKFSLGKKYSDSLFFLQRDSSDLGNFVLLNPATDYKIIKLLSYTFQIQPTLTAPTSSYSSLPPWITFDYENQVLSVDSKKQSDLGNYTLYSISSKKILLDVFNGTKLPDSVISEDLVTLLISLGYMDNQQFLTSSFGSLEKFLLPSLYKSYKEEIYSTLQGYRVETFTDFEILPSLKFSAVDNKKFSIVTPSNYSVKVDIKLHDETRAEFLQKNYGILRPVITDHKSRLIIEGPLDLINQAIQNLVINLNNTNSSCSGEITINDKMNPPISQTYANISSYFFKNEAPEVNSSYPFTLQQQIDHYLLYTGQSFTISIDPNTFMDHHSDTLIYEIIKQDTPNNLPPSWLTLQNGLTIKGTPPEDFFHREVSLMLIVKNEFKQIKIPFVLNIRISMLFAGKLLMKYAPYILGIVGLIVSANRIYSILMKKRYRHAKDFYVRAGEEITPSVIFPIKFIAEERAEGELILKNLLLSENSGDEAKIREAIKEIVSGLTNNTKEKMKLYLQGGVSGQKRVEQYIINDVIMQQLDATEEKATKNLFDNVKEDWIEFIEYEDDSFKVNESKLENLLIQIQEKRSKLNKDLAETINDSLLSENGPEINFALLKKALVVYASRKHEINYQERKVDVEVKRKTERSFIMRFLKKDLERIPYSEKSRMVYGINYRIQGDALYISGTPDENFAGKILVVQIISKRQRILKELWIYGVASSVDSEDKGKIQHKHGVEPLQMIDKSYEVF